MIYEAPIQPKEITFKEACAIAEEYGVSKRALQWYITQGLIPKPERSGKDSIYKDLPLRWYLFSIGELREYGFTIPQIKELIKTFKGGIEEIVRTLIETSIHKDEVLQGKDINSPIVIMAIMSFRNLLRNNIRGFLMGKRKEITKKEVEELYSEAYGLAGKQTLHA